MSGTINPSAFTPVIREVVRQEIDGKSVIAPEDVQAGLGVHSFNTSRSPVRTEGPITVGTGHGQAGYIFSPQPDAFNPALLLGHAQDALGESIMPGKPRRASCNIVFMGGALGENTQATLQWAPPVVDSANRWLETQYSDFTGSSEQDSIMYYLVRRTTVATGEVITAGMVPHSKQAVSLIRAYLEAEAAASRPGAVTDPLDHTAVIDPALFLPLLDINGDPILDTKGNPLTELVIPNGEDVFFSFTDTTTQFGMSYVYTIAAITTDQTEGAATIVVPGAPAAAGGLTLAFTPSWCSSYPDTGSGELTDGRTAYADLVLQVGSLVSTVDVCLLPIMDNALVVDTSDLPATDPYICETQENGVVFLKGGSTPINQGCFTARNFDENGGVQSVTLPVGFTGCALTKGEQISGTTSDFKYMMEVSVGATAVAGPQTFTFIFVNGKTCTWSHTTVKDITVIPAGNGCVFTLPGNVYRQITSTTRKLVLTGTKMNTIQSITATPALTTFTITKQSVNSITITYTAFTGTVALGVVLKATYTTTGKDTCSLVVSGVAVAPPRPIIICYSDTSDVALSSISVTRVP